MNERKPLSRSFHPAALFWISGISAMVSAIMIFNDKGILPVYLHVAGWIILWQIIQVYSDFRNSERWYRSMTTFPYRITLREFVKLRWPAMLAILPFCYAGFPAAAVWLMCLIFYYPWQRSLYLRSYREFGKGH
ncbi:MAG: hypothetical protein QM627_04600 [Luteolibacter sp.]